MLFMAKAGDVAQPALERTWNVGVGMVAVVAPEVADLTLKSLAARGMKAWIAGEVVKSEDNETTRSRLASNYKG
jgi:phosphoribosylformylglycinamidine cyclo-ligase